MSVEQIANSPARVVHRLPSVRTEEAHPKRALLQATYANDFAEMDKTVQVLSALQQGRQNAVEHFRREDERRRIDLNGPTLKQTRRLESKVRNQDHTLEVHVRKLLRLPVMSAPQYYGRQDGASGLNYKTPEGIRANRAFSLLELAPNNAYAAQAIVHTIVDTALKHGDYAFLGGDDFHRALFQYANHYDTANRMNILQAAVEGFVTRTRALLDGTSMTSNRQSDTRRAKTVFPVFDSRAHTMNDGDIQEVLDVFRKIQRFQRSIKEGRDMDAVSHAYENVVTAPVLSTGHVLGANDHAEFTDFHHTRLFTLSVPGLDIPTVDEVVRRAVHVPSRRNMMGFDGLAEGVLERVRPAARRKKGFPAAAEDIRYHLLFDWPEPELPAVPGARQKPREESGMRSDGRVVNVTPALGKLIEAHEAGRRAKRLYARQEHRPIVLNVRSRRRHNAGTSA